MHHDSATNAFNLADDLLETLRPTVDLLVVRHLRDHPDREELTLDDRRSMAAAPNAPVRIGAETLSALTACERMAQSFCRVVASGDWRALELPELVDPEAEP